MFGKTSKATQLILTSCSTTGGAGGTTTTVSSLAELTAAAAIEEPMVIYVSGMISGPADKVDVSSDTSIIGLNSDSGMSEVGLSIDSVSNVIVQNLAISKVVAENGDAILIQESTNVWVDHCDLSSDLDGQPDKDYYDGLLDITHGADWITVSNTYFHDHWKASLVGNSDSTGDEDSGHLHVTYANNHWYNVNSRTPSLRFGTGHVINSYYEKIVDSGANTRQGAQILIESTVFVDSGNPVTHEDEGETGYAMLNDVDLGGGENDAPEGNLTVEYEYELLGSENVKAAVVGVAGNTLSF